MGDWVTELRKQLKETSVLSKPSHHENFKRASVLVLLDSEGNVLLTRRSLSLRSHPGEVCFPGGKADPGENEITTALRECHEEVGLQFSVTRERIRQIEAKALRKLKHPSRSKQLKSFLES